jgi:hypothetical protein
VSIFKNYIGQHVVVRTYSAGVHIGTLIEVEGQAAELTNARRLWKWNGAFTLSEVATSGINPKNSRMSEPVARLVIFQAIEIIPTTDKARSTFDATHE